MNLRTKEAAAATGAMLLATAFAVASYRSPAGFFQTALLGVATTLLGASIALLIVNVYLHQESKRAAVRAILGLIGPSIQSYHNTFLKAGHDTFGVNTFNKFRDDYTDSQGDPRVFSPEERRKIYNLIKSLRPTLVAQLQRLDEQIRELSFVLGWSFSPGVLALCFRARAAIAAAQLVGFDDSATSQRDACEHFLDADIHTHILFDQLIDILGLPQEKVYGSRPPD